MRHVRSIRRDLSPAWRPYRRHGRRSNEHLALSRAMLAPMPHESTPISSSFMPISSDADVLSRTKTPRNTQKASHPRRRDIIRSVLAPARRARTSGSASRRPSHPPVLRVPVHREEPMGRSRCHSRSLATILERRTRPLDSGSICAFFWASFSGNACRIGRMIEHVVLDVDAQRTVRIVPQHPPSLFLRFLVAVHVGQRLNDIPLEFRRVRAIGEALQRFSRQFQ